MQVETSDIDIGMVFRCETTGISWRPVTFKLSAPFTDMDDPEHWSAECTVRVPVSAGESIEDFTVKARAVCGRCVRNLGAILCSDATNVVPS